MLTFALTVSAAFDARQASAAERAQEENQRLAEILAPESGQKVERVAEMKGRLKAKEGWPVVLVQPVVEGELWYVQPAVKKVEEGGIFAAQVRFGNDKTEPGTEFRLVVVVAKDKERAYDFKPGDQLRSPLADLPASQVITVTRNGAKQGKKWAVPKTRQITFAGHTWEVKSGKRGPGPNHFSDATENVGVDEAGHLKLALTQADDRWLCAEVFAKQSLGGHGEYLFVISGNFADFDPNVVLGLFVYESDKREIDLLELSRWGDPKKDKAQCVVQPYTAEGHMHRFDTGQAKVLTCSLLWDKTTVRCRCWAGEDTSRVPLADWKCISGNLPRPGNERVHINLWLFKGQPPASKGKHEVIIRRFEFRVAAREEGHP